MHKHQDRPASSRQWLRRHDLLNFIATLYEGDLHAKRVLSLANATQGVLTSASLAIHAVGRGLAQAMGTLTKHGVKQLSSLGVEFMSGKQVEKLPEDCGIMGHGLDLLSFERFGAKSFYQTRRFQVALISKSMGQ